MSQVNSTFFRITVIFLIFIIKIQTANAVIIEPYRESISGSQIATNVIFIADDNRFQDPAWSFIETNHNVDNIIYLEFLENHSDLISYNFDYTVEFTIAWYDENNVMKSFSSVLVLNNDTAAGSKYKIKDILEFKGAHKIKLTINNIIWNSNGGPLVAPDIFKLGIDILVTRSLNFDPNVTATFQNSSNSDSLVWWSNELTEEYDLEWLFLDKFSNEVLNLTSFKAAELFRFNSTRVTLSGTEYHLPKIYPEGILLARIRRVRYTIDGIREEGKWNVNDNTYYTVSSYPYSYSVSSTLAQEPDINWQAQTVFAENGKRIINVGYHDGALKKRQTITSNEETNDVVVSHTVFDHLGRPAVNVLPTPIEGKALTFKENFAKNINSENYGPDDFELGGCDSSLGIMNNNFGSSKYYSQNNPNKGSFPDKFIPNAEGYPFTVTEWTPDATGKIRRQSGVGPEFVFGKHETKYIYANPTQIELTRLFGTQVGKRTHYFKNGIADPNGQYSITFQDAHGRTVATALSGDAPLNFDPIQMPVQPNVTESILDSIQTIENGVISSYFNIAVTKTGNYEFDYALSPNFYKDLCSNEAICYNCIYDLIIIISDDCGNAFNNGVPYTVTKENYNLFDPAFKDSCIVAPIGFDSTFIVTLEPGTYNITKKLIVNQNALDFYTERYLEDTACVYDINYFVDKYNSYLSNYNCELNCDECDNLTDSIYFFDTYIASLYPNGHVLSNEELEGALAAYKEIKIQCHEQCNFVAPNACDALYDQLLGDVSPGGQYFKYEYDANNNIVADTNGFNILPILYKAQIYKDANGVLEKEVNYKGSSYPVNELPVEGFVLNFKSSWAKELVKYHPEYCYWEWCNSEYESFEYDQLMSSVNSYQEAYDLGLLNPLGTAGGDYPKGTEDPFFINNPLYLDGMKDSLNNINGINYSAWQLASMMTYCYPEYLNCTPPIDIDQGCEQDADLGWHYFRSLYLFKKQYFYEKVRSDSANYDNCNLTSITASHIQRVVDIDTTLNNLNLPSIYDDVNSWRSTVYNEFNKVKITNCEAYSSNWFEELKTNCGFIDTNNQTWLNIKKGLIAVCIAGTDEGNIFGASSTPSGTYTSVYINGQTYQFSSFQSVFDAFVPGNEEFCNVNNISSPGPHGKNPVMSGPVIIDKPDSCTCAQIDKFKQEYDNLGGGSTFEEYLNRNYNSLLTQGELDTLELLCQEGFEFDCAFVEPIKLPAIFACRVIVDYIDTNPYYTYVGQECATCDSVAKSVIKFLTDYPGVGQNPRYQIMLSNYLNNNFALSLGFYEYAEFLSKCASEESGVIDSLLAPSFVASYIPIKDTSVTQSHIIVQNYWNQVNSNNWIPPSGSDPLFIDSFLNYFNNYFGYNLTFTDYYIIFKDHYGSSLLDSLNWQGLLFNPSVPDCNSLLDLITIFNNCHQGAPFYEGYNCQLTTYLNKYYGNGKTFIYYYDIIEACYGSIASYNLMGQEFDCEEEFDCGAVISYIEDWAISNSSLMELGVSVYGPSLTEDLNAEFNKNLTLCDYYRISLRCLSPDEVLELFRYSLPFCSDEIDCTQLGNTILYFNSFTEHDKGSPDYMDALTTYLISVFSLNEEFIFCDFYNIMYRCYEENEGSVIDLMGEGPDCLQLNLTCSRISYYLNEFQIENPNAPYIVDFRDEITGYLNDMLGIEYSFCDYYRFYRNCFGINLTHQNFDQHIDCEVEVQCSDLEGEVNVFIYGYGDDESPTYQSDLTAHLNSHFNIQHTFCEWFSLYNFCFGMEATIQKFKDNTTCPNTICADCNIVMDEINNYNFANPGAPDIPQNMLKVTSWLNQNLNYSLSYDQYYILIKECAGLDAVVNLLGSNFNGIQGGVGIDYSQYLLYNSTYLGQNKLCDNGMQVAIAEDTCGWNLQILANTQATLEYDSYIEEKRKAFRINYMTQCLQSIETLTMNYDLAEHHYTLYYYDQAGNLVETVPPVGVEPDGTGNNHRMSTRYRYNSLNEVREQETPDGGLTKFWYDRLGRIVVSQNAKQAKDEMFPPTTNIHQTYSYTLYDPLGRIVEVGKLKHHQPIDDNISQNDAAYSNWILGGVRRGEVTQTFYDESHFSSIHPEFLNAEQRNLRGRVTHITYSEYWDTVDSTYDNATHYSYDISGNVDELVQEIGGLPGTQKTRHMYYEYDLISGNVNKVWYEKGKRDQFIHRYSYDKNNRLTDVYTSTSDVIVKYDQPDNIVSEHEANYTYYRHGPLARVELGQRKVQGLDYAYTLQGWIKGVNSGFLDSTYDMGKDAKPLSINANTAKDAFGYTLGYFEGDYKPIGTGTTGFKNFEPQYTSSGFNDASNNLYNGNIRNMITSITGLTEPTIGYAYKYDQLNRIKGMQSFTNNDIATNSWNTGGNTTKFRTSYIYDGNGNIEKLVRYDNTGSLLDYLLYSYGGTAATRLNNRLLHVQDLAGSTTYNDDYEHLTAFGTDTLFTYDEIGNLIKDESDSLDLNIEWNVYGKIKSIKTPTDSIIFSYDAGGNRISKKVKKSTGEYVQTFYFRDATGNVMATYTANSSEAEELKELHVYGSSRLGIYTPGDLTKLDTTIFGTGYTNVLQYGFEVGEKQYELSNHLGNVLSTISDKKVGIDINNDDSIDYYIADIISAQDYYPFGMTMSGRTFSSNSYKYGFNGKEKDDEVKGNGNSLDFGARIYDSRLAKMLSIDPKTKRFSSMSPYNYAVNNPIVNIDEEGENPILGILKKIAETNNVTLAVAYGATIEHGLVTSISRGMAVDPHGNTLFFTTKGGLAANLSFLKDGLSTDVGYNVNVGAYVLNGVPNVKDLLGKGRDTKGTVGFGILQVSSTDHVLADGSAAGYGLEVGIGFSAIPYSISQEGTNTTGLILSSGNISKIQASQNISSKMATVGAERGTNGMREEYGSYVAFWEIGSTDFTYKEIGKGEFEIVVTTRIYQQWTGSGREAVGYDKFKNEESFYTIPTGVIVQQDDKGNYISKDVKDKPNNK